MTEYDVEKDPKTWAYALNQHWIAFNDAIWKGFNAYCDEMLEKGHENKIDRLKWREYVLWDMQQKHEKELKE